MYVSRNGHPDYEGHYHVWTSLIVQFSDQKEFGEKLIKKGIPVDISLYHKNHSGLRLEGGWKFGKFKQVPSISPRTCMTGTGYIPCHG